MSSIRRFTLLVALLAGLVLVGACSSGSSKTKDSGGGATTTTKAADTTLDSAGTDTSDTGTDSGDTGTDTSDTGTDTGDIADTGDTGSVPIAGPEAGSKFCKDFKALLTDEQVADAFSSTGDTATQLRKIKAAYAKIAGVFDSLAGSAPAAIHDDFEALNKTYQTANQQVQAVTSVNDIATLSAFEELGSPEMDARTKTISDYARSHCGFDPDELSS